MNVPAVQLVDVALRKALTDAAIPFDSVSIGDAFARATWSVAYAAAATPAQRTQGAAIVATLDPTNPTTIADVKAELATNDANRDLIRAVVQGLYEAIPNPPIALDTLAKLKARILTIYRGLL